MADCKRRKLSTLSPHPQDIVNTVFELYNKLPKTGKPQSNDYTTLAAVVGTGTAEAPCVISLATGSKCLPCSRRSEHRLNDSHAEVIAKRAAVDFALSEFEHLLSLEKDNIPDTNALLFKKDPIGVSRTEATISLVVTEPPCGDCVVASSIETSQLYRTGAKPIDFLGRAIPSSSDVETGEQSRGVLRRKPGKGESTSSLSCSDKLLRWSFLGFQGSQLLSLFKTPLYFDSIIICAPSNGVESAVLTSMNRALIERAGDLPKRLIDPFKWHAPKIYIVSPPPEGLPFRKNQIREKTSNFCINWTRKIKGTTPNDTQSDLKKQQLEQNGYFEVTLGNLGVKCGAPKKYGLTATVPYAFQSRLCHQAMNTRANVKTPKENDLYLEQWKKLAQKPSVFGEWITLERKRFKKTRS